MKKYTYTGTQPFTGMLAGKEVLLSKGETVELDSDNDGIKAMVASRLLEETPVLGNTNSKLTNTSK